MGENHVFGLFPPLVLFAFPCKVLRHKKHNFAPVVKTLKPPVLSKYKQSHFVPPNTLNWDKSPPQFVHFVCLFAFLFFPACKAAFPHLMQSTWYALQGIPVAAMLTMRCWKSQERMMLVACLGRTPRLFLDFLSSPSRSEVRSRFTCQGEEQGEIQMKMAIKNPSREHNQPKWGVWWVQKTNHGEKLPKLICYSKFQLNSILHQDLYHLKPPFIFLPSAVCNEQLAFSQQCGTSTARDHGAMPQPPAMYISEGHFKQTNKTKELKRRQLSKLFFAAWDKNPVIH